MRLVNSLLAFFACLIFFIACKKDSSPNIGTGTTALNIVNAIPGSTDLLPSFNNQLSYRQVGLYRTIPYGIYSFFNNIYSFPGGVIHLSVRQVSDTLHAVYENASLDLPNNTSHSLFLTGTVNNPESILTNDILPDHGPQGHGATDSVAGIRFINLLVGSSPVSVNIQGTLNGSEVSSLAYKSITDFKNYAATTNVSSYKFEFRNAATGTLLTTYTLSGVNQASPTTRNNILFKNVTIALIGMSGGIGSNAPAVFSYYPGQY